MRREIQNLLKSAFLPEFLNRIDETIIFHPLGLKELAKIVDIQLGRLERQLSEAGLALRVTDQARARLAEEGFDPAYGARPLKRVIQQRLANPLATALLEQKDRGRRRRGDRLERVGIHVHTRPAGWHRTLSGSGRAIGRSGSKWPSNSSTRRPSACLLESTVRRRNQ